MQISMEPILLTVRLLTTGAATPVETTVYEAFQSPAVSRVCNRASYLPYDGERIRDEMTLTRSLHNLKSHWIWAIMHTCVNYAARPGKAAGCCCAWFRAAPRYTKRAIKDILSSAMT